MVIPDDGLKITAVVIVAATAARLFFVFAPVLQGSVTLAQFVVARLHRRAAKARYLALAADQAVIVYKQAEADDKSCPKSLWMEIYSK